MNTMTAREERRLLGSVLAMALALIGLVMLSALGGCATGTRKALSIATTAAVQAVEVTDKVCMQYAKQWCETNPCPALETCKAALRHLTSGAASMTAGAKLANEVIRD